MDNFDYKNELSPNYSAYMGHGNPAKSWNFIISFSRPGKSWNLSVGHRKPWKMIFIKNNNNKLDFFSKENGNER